MKHQYNISTFTNNDSKSYYILGAFLADGCITTVPQYRAVISSKDHDWLEIFRDHICPTLPVYSQKTTTEKYKAIRICNKEIVNWFIKNECVPRKSLTVKMPSIPSSFLPDFFRGLLDGDGTIAFNPSKKSIIAAYVSASKTLANQIKELLNNLGFRFSIVTTKSKQRESQGKRWISKELFRIQTSGANAYRFLKWIYYDGFQMCLQRKYEKAKQLFCYYETRPSFLAKDRSKYCKIKWPSDEDLKAMVETNGYLPTSRELGISATAISNRLQARGYSIKLKPGRRPKSQPTQFA